MKKRITALFLLLFMGTIGFADPNPRDLKVSKLLQENLAKEFPGAEDVKWEKIGDFYVAAFKHDEGKMSAYFEEEGMLYKTTRFIDPAYLPLVVNRSLNERFDLKDKDKKVLEVSRASDTYYLISFQHNNRQYIVDSDPSGNLKVVKKAKL